MASKEQCDRFATEMAHRFEEFTTWAVEHWPNKDTPLLSSDFAESRKEIGHILGSRLNEGRSDLTEPSGNDDGGQFVQMTPAPWP